MISVYRPPLIVKKLFNDFIWQTSNNKILLTFDDGPSETVTPRILEILVQSRIKAAFFCIGMNISTNIELAKQIIEEGHLIGNHTMNHRLLTKMNADESLQEIRQFNELMKEMLSYNVKYFRPPHGRFNLNTNRLMRKLNLKNVMWSLLSYDYEDDIEKVKDSIDNYLTHNSIIVFHDSIKSSSLIEESLYHIIDAATKKAFEFGEPEDCLK